MKLTKEQIVANTEKYIATGKKMGFLTPELEELLGTNFIGAPSATDTKYGNAFEGGLVDHILRVMGIAYKINESLDEADKISVVSLVKAVYLFQIGKCCLFKPKNSDWHNERGTWYEYNEDLTSMSLGERSIWYCMKGGVELTEAEYIAILNHDKTDDKQSQHHNNDLGIILSMANKLAINKEKELAK
jgi:hypothetical protein